MGRRIGILGGTFNPVHIGHLRAAEEAAEALELDVCLLMPASTPPHKNQPDVISFEHRWNMLGLALEDNPRLDCSDLERSFSGKSYSVITLRTLAERLEPDCELYFLVGLDAYWELDTWKEYRELFRLARIVALRRPGYSTEQLGSFLSRKVSERYAWSVENRRFEHPERLPVYYVEITPLDISATDLRFRAGRGLTIRYLVPDTVLHYIREHRLYRAKRETG
jgi:nicotinate-nucleotide adenylyltransferase